MKEKKKVNQIQALKQSRRLMLASQEEFWRWRKEKGKWIADIKHSISERNLNDF